MSRDRVAVIGAGVSGIACTKACLEEGLEPVCFEQFGYVGGLWHFTSEVLPGQGAVAYESLLTNTSKSMTCFSDMPFSRSYPEYLSHTQVKEYLERYVEKFGLKGNINLQHRVTDVRPSKTYEKDGSWVVTVRDLVTDALKTETFKYVAICNGRHGFPKYPNISGMDSFQGEIMHAISYRNYKQFLDKNVLVIGNANSAGDLAVDACRCAKRVYLSLGAKGTWITSRNGPDGKGPNLDFSLRKILTHIPLFIFNWFLTRTANKEIDHRKYGIASSDSKGPMYSAFLVNDKIAGLIKSGNVFLRPALKSLKSRSAFFSDGSHIEDVDLVIFATGYQTDWTLLSDSRQTCSWENMPLYKMVWPTHLVHHTLAVAGKCSVRGPVIGSLELQARWIAAVFSSRCHLPSPDQMDKEAALRKQALIKRYGYLKFSVDGLTYPEELVDELGIRPPFFRTLFTRPMELYHWYFGPCVNMLHRLYGPHSWDGARDAIDTALRSAKDDQEMRVNGSKLK